MTKRNACILILMLSMVFVFSKKQEKDCIPSIYPVNGYIIREFGEYTDPSSGEKKFNKGIHIGAKIRSKVIAVAEGIIKTIGKQEDSGYVVTIDHGCGYTTRYVHLMKNLKVKEGQKVKRHDVIGFLGDSGSKKEPFLYYEIRYNNKPINPSSVILSRTKPEK